MTTEQTLEPWYELAKSDEVLQGDFVTELWTPEPAHPFRGPPDATPPPPEIDYTYVPRLVVVSQSCDLTQDPGHPDDHRYALLAPTLTLAEVKASSFSGSLRDLWSNARRGQVPNWHAIAACDIEGFEFGHALVSLDQLVPMRLDQLRSTLANDNHVRMKSPYREALGQALARQFMRVGLPIAVPDWKEVRAEVEGSEVAGQSAST